MTPRTLVRQLPSLVHARLPRSGFANMLIVFLRAAVLADLNGLPYVSTGWLTPRVGPWLRRETRKRLYFSYVRHDGPIALARLATAKLACELIDEPPIAVVPQQRGALLRVHRLPQAIAYFDDLRAHRDICARHLRRVLSDASLSALDASEAPVVGIHVRRGDFRKLAPGERIETHFGQTPIEHFVAMLQAVRRVAGSELRATIFSDGTDAELAPLLSLPNTRRAAPASDVVDMLTLAKSRVILCSAHSTFSFVAGFFSEAEVLLVPVAQQGRIRPDDVNARHFEGMVGSDSATWPALLRQNLRALSV